ncbi:hypothetical protein D9M68_355930 [compost metagenome]
MAHSFPGGVPCPATVSFSTNPWQPALPPACCWPWPPAVGRMRPRLPAARPRRRRRHRPRWSRNCSRKARPARGQPRPSVPITPPRCGRCPCLPLPRWRMCCSLAIATCPASSTSIFPTTRSTRSPAIRSPPSASMSTPAATPMCGASSTAASCRQRMPCGWRRWSTTSLTATRCRKAMCPSASASSRRRPPGIRKPACCAWRSGPPTAASSNCPRPTWYSWWTSRAPWTAAKACPWCRALSNCWWTSCARRTASPWSPMPGRRGWCWVPRRATRSRRSARPSNSSVRAAPRRASRAFSWPMPKRRRA